MNILEISDAQARCRRRAVTMVESIVSLLIVSGLLIAALNTVGASARTRNTRVQQGLGPGLAMDLMHEILQAPFAETLTAAEQHFIEADGSEVESPATSGTTNGMGLDPGESNATRLTFDDLDDYHGWHGDPPQDKVGNAIPGFTGWTRDVQIQNIDPTDVTITLADTATSSLRRIIVAATSPEGHQTVRVGLRARSGTYDAMPPAHYLTWVGATVQAANAVAPTTTGTYLMNGIRE